MTMTMTQTITITMGIGLAQFWTNLFLYSYEEKYMSPLISSDKIKARNFHSTKCSTDDICTVNDGEEIERSICPKELELKIFECQYNHQGGKLICKLFDKKDFFPFSIVRMPHIESNIPQSIFYSAIKGEFLRISRSTICLRDFIYLRLKIY